MLITRLSGAWSRADGTEEEVAWLRDYLTFRDARAFWSRGPTHYSLVKRDGSFPSGLIDKVVLRAIEAKLEIKVIDNRTPIPAADPSIDTGWLRDYQRAAFDEALRRETGILHLPTGAGKTEIFCALAASVRSRWLFLAHREQLVNQTARRYTDRTGEVAGLVCGGRLRTGRVTCATFQSLPGAMEYTREVQGLVVDEAHTLPAATFYKAAMSIPARIRIGLSATPLARDDKRSVLAVAALGPVIYRVKAEALIEQGVLARPKIRMVRLVQESDRPTWQGVYGECVVRSAARNRQVVEMARKCERPFLVFVKEVAHGRAVAQSLTKAGLTTQFVWGQRDVLARERAVKDLERGALDCIVCSVVFQEGVDIPCLRGVVIASGGKSTIAAVQRIGRGSRVEAGKTEFEVWDLADEGNAWLKAHARKRRRAYEGEGYDVEVIDGL